MLYPVIKILIIILFVICIVVSVLLIHGLRSKSRRENNLTVPKLGKVLSTSFTSLCILLSLLNGFKLFTDQEHYKIKEVAYTKALEIATQHILATDIKLNDPKFPNAMYLAKTCGNEPSQQEKNDTYNLLALAADNSDILVRYLEILLPTTTSPVVLRDNLLNAMRNDLGLQKMDIKIVNNGYSLITNSSCLSTSTIDNQK